LRKLQAHLEASYIDFFYRFHSSQRDPNRHTTAIGSLGILKLSDRIVLRVEPDQNLSEPLFLAEASYNYYAYGTWTNIDRKTEVVDPELNGTSWLLRRPDDGNRHARVTAYHSEDEAVLPLPQGTTAIHGLSAFQLERTNTDSLQAELEPGWNSWDINYHERQILSSTPVSADLHAGQTYREDLARLATELGLYGKSGLEIRAMVERFFEENFRYSLHQKRRYPRGKYLSKFLFEDRKGHCEYFATATTLLLRTAGVPARYVVGYVVDEYSNFEGAYVARSRHAHSWVMAWIDGRWVRVDTTPAVWAELEGENQSSFQFVGDFLSWSRLRTDRFLDSPLVRSLDPVWLIAVLFFILVVKVYLRKRKDTVDQDPGGNSQSRDVSMAGDDSPLFEYIRRLEAAGYRRAPGETLQEWFNRLSDRIPGVNHPEVPARHNDYRFNPVTRVGRSEIEKLVQTVLPDIKPVSGQ
ncbi:MAG: transglutaminase domain-containing protein, partial [Gammaproteobacteria bacterium]|nr:transglutaminase domain-containing protein [Gammaproteobacteria bacterium]